ncbi:MAG: hypothetical protein OSA52_09615, partial [Yoonia sp.]|nr:hypothetical protein [Yoonia sp.]
MKLPEMIVTRPFHRKVRPSPKGRWILPKTVLRNLANFDRFWRVRSRRFSESRHWCNRSEMALCPHSVSSTFDLRCTLHQWLVFLLRGSTEF